MIFRRIAERLSLSFEFLLFFILSYSGVVDEVNAAYSDDAKEWAK